MLTLYSPQYSLIHFKIKIIVEILEQATVKSKHTILKLVARSLHLEIKQKTKTKCFTFNWFVLWLQFLMKNINGLPWLSHIKHIYFFSQTYFDSLRWLASPDNKIFTPTADWHCRELCTSVKDAQMQPLGIASPGQRPASFQPISALHLAENRLRNEKPVHEAALYSKLLYCYNKANLQAV